jgi:hypothetical protein
MTRGKRQAFVGGALALLALSACSSRHETVTIQPIGGAEAAQAQNATALIAAGRAFLAEQNYGLAITRFRDALAFEAGSAAANNGLGIAYASIGRDDLARRYFERAIAFDPQTPAYRRNLDLFAAKAAESSRPEALAMTAPIDSAPEMRYRLRQEASSPPVKPAAISVPLPAGDAGTASPRLVAQASGVTLTTKTAPKGAAAPAFALVQERSAASGSAPAPVLKRVSIREVQIVTRRPADALAEIMKRDYLAQWNRPTAPAPSRGETRDDQDAFRAAVRGVRQKIAAQDTAAAAVQSCNRLRLATPGFAGIAAGATRCPS